jgi:uncharacterized protein (TIGR02996 family)
MTDAPALLAAIRAAPDDDAPRLVYADWLDEHGQPERAAFIRIQCELARTGDPALRRREAELLAEHHDAFAGHLAAPHLRFRFERGFVAGFGHTGIFVAHRGGGMILLRFFPDRLVISTGIRRTNDVPELFDRRNKYLLRGIYDLEASGFPAMMKFECTSAAENQDISFSGTFDGESLSPGGLTRINGYPLLRQFAHQHHDAFDSFPET